MDKSKLVNTLKKMQDELISELEEKVATTNSMVDLDEGDTIDPEDFSHQSESGELNSLIKAQLVKSKLNRTELDSIDFSPKSSVEEGAVVETNLHTIVVGFPTIPFDFEGYHIVGISKDAPLYPYILGKKEGNNFSFSGRDYEIKKIH